jgi:hypothetical protein
MTKANVFISFDHDHDRELRDELEAQGKNLDSPFQMTDSSVKELFTDDWQKEIRSRIQKVDQVIFICGKFTNSARGVNLEYTIAQEEGKPYFLLQGRTDKAWRTPRLVNESDKVYAWTWDNLKLLVGGAR